MHPDYPLWNLFDIYASKKTFANHNPLLYNTSPRKGFLIFQESLSGVSVLEVVYRGVIFLEEKRQ